MALCPPLTSCTVVTGNSPPEEAAERHHRRAHRERSRPAPAPTGAAQRDDFVGVSTLPEQPAKKEPPRSTLGAATLPSGAATGRPPGYAPDAPAAYWIWQGPRGDWRIRTTASNAPHTFSGYVQGTTGPIAQLEPSRLELRDRIWQTDAGWAFSFRSAAHADGFTFTVPDNGCARFDLRLDGGPVPKKIFVGRRQIEPSTGHFVVCPATRR